MHHGDSRNPCLFNRAISPTATVVHIPSCGILPNRLKDAYLMGDEGIANIGCADPALAVRFLARYQVPLATSAIVCSRAIAQLWKTVTKICL